MLITTVGAPPTTSPRKSPGSTEEMEPKPACDSVELSSDRTQKNLERIQRQLEFEWRFFGRQTQDKNKQVIREGRREDHNSVYGRVGYYWRRGCDLEFDGKDRHQPWSAAFISSVHLDAGVGDQFLTSPYHARYVRDAILKRQDGDESAAYWGYRLSERAPQVGDMVVYSRQEGIDYDNQPPVYKSHADIVTEVRDGEVDVIGGNVRNSVTKKTLTTDENGMLIDENYNWFTVLAPNDLS